MTKNTNSVWSCQSGGSQFPVLATVTGVASCFAEAILRKYVELGSGFAVLLAVGQMVPLAFVLRYFVTRLRPSPGLTSARKVS